VNFNHFLSDETVHLNLMTGNMFSFLSFYEVDSRRASWSPKIQEPVSPDNMLLAERITERSRASCSYGLLMAAPLLTGAEQP
jgi:hypothetical protein